MTGVPLDDVDFQKSGGLVPVVVQEATTREVLMVAFANREAVEQTLRTGYAHYFSRSRNRLWRKGETSGHVQRVRAILVDCDRDTLLYLVEQTGVACHRGTRSCFTEPLSESPSHESLSA
ncbi:MAG: phosphoribosyl-AMP cyclohydrolase [Blastocatellia bacterium]|nr:phosphoribosyl-AMP cyclohydrolase [Blastocatellia bacterium]MCS7157568.1 phosphoribosyl-AMP cyclohydrolase [Blastocatellia bacterium]MCX7753520.1 phosphoribosyl-AMP cyclohydrolase [Blastocatellia bacterium]MDW8166936.1 phosphoribosyl-AMP cyclohydrolase [Acidobacteriota bacterium]MDW8257513.1 phosphoribosyl-AMP cyclohydrolase [Acidobacteriota bacterium]